MAWQVRRGKTASSDVCSLGSVSAGRVRPCPAVPLPTQPLARGPSAARAPLSLLVQRSVLRKLPRAFRPMSPANHRRGWVFRRAVPRFGEDVPEQALGVTPAVGPAADKSGKQNRIPIVSRGIVGGGGVWLPVHRHQRPPGAGDLDVAVVRELERQSPGPCLHADPRPQARWVDTCTFALSSGGSCRAG